MKIKKRFLKVDLKKAKEKGLAMGLREAVEQNREKRINEFIERTWPEDGKARLPFSLLLDTGIRDFMEYLDFDPINFSNKYIDQLDWFISFIDSLPDTDDFEDVAKQARKFHEQQANAGHAISFTDAVAHVSGCSNDRTLERILNR